MPTFVLWVKAELEGLTQFWAPEDHCWTLDVKQGGGAEERKGVVIDPEDWSDVANTKDTKANFVMKFDKADKQQSYLNVVQIKGVTRPQTAEDTGMVPLIAFECRGLEPVRWTPTGPYCGSAEGGASWDNIDLKNEDWCEYDEKLDIPVGVNKEIAYEFRLHK